MTGYRITGSIYLSFWRPAQNVTEHKSEKIDQVVTAASSGDAILKAVEQHLGPRFNESVTWEWEDRVIEAVGEDVIMKASGQPSLFGDDL